MLELSNWRPITLLNVDFKIVAKARAKRLESILPHLIHPDQTGFVKGRYIGENITPISDIMEYTKLQKIPGILVSLDFCKAFDSIEWPFIMKTLESTVLNNGFATNWFKPSKGVRQGCPLSPYLFILSAEILAHKIRQLNFNQRLKVLQTKLDMWSAQDLTLFGKEMIIKTWAYLSLFIQHQILSFLQESKTLLKQNVLNFFVKTKTKKHIKRSGLYQDTSKGGLRMTDIGLMFKSLNPAWIARLLATGKRSWCTVPNHFFRKMGGVDFILRCNYNAKYFNRLPVFYKKNILDSFNELKTLKMAMTNHKI